MHTSHEIQYLYAHLMFIFDMLSDDVDQLYERVTVFFIFQEN